jgi:hypothetical protein
MSPSAEPWFDVDFAVQLSWQSGQKVQRMRGRCVALSASAVKLETHDPLGQATTILVHSRDFGRMGLATVRHCGRNALKYEVELRFGAALHLDDPARRRILDGLIRKPFASETASPPQRAILAKQFV